MSLEHMQAYVITKRSSNFNYNLRVDVQIPALNINHQTCQPGECFRWTFRVNKRDLPAKSGTVGRAHIEIFFRSIQPTEINCVPKYTVARRFGRGTVWYFCEKSNGFSVITLNWMICINVGAPRQR